MGAALYPHADRFVYALTLSPHFEPYTDNMFFEKLKPYYTNDVPDENRLMVETAAFEIIPGLEDTYDHLIKSLHMATQDIYFFESDSEVHLGVVVFYLQINTNDPLPWSTPYNTDSEYYLLVWPFKSFDEQKNAKGLRFAQRDDAAPRINPSDHTTSEQSNKRRLGGPGTYY
jgi:hypothetical protein